jgi:POT family proton-dependent oligopeptide transporter
MEKLGDIQSSSLDEKNDLASTDADEPEYLEGSEGVTQNDLINFRQIPDALPWAAFLVVVVEFAERSVFYVLPPCYPNVVQSWTYYGTTNVCLSPSNPSLCPHSPSTALFQLYSSRSSSWLHYWRSSCFPQG